MKRNAIILAAGTSSRFVPLSQEVPKGLLEVKGEVLIERQIRQLKEAGISDITIVVGYKADKFKYLKEKFGVNLVFNEDYGKYNNTSSLIRVLELLDNTFICSSDNHFPNNVFKHESDRSYYSALYAPGKTSEYCIESNEKNEIVRVTVGGKDSWYMCGHVFLSSDFSTQFKSILKKEYEREETRMGYWEDVYIRYIDILPPMHINRYDIGDIFEFDTLEDLRKFDESYQTDTRSRIIKDLATQFCCKESDLKNFRNIPHEGDYLLFSFEKNGILYRYNDQDSSISRPLPKKTNPYTHEILITYLSQIFANQDVSSAELVRIGGMSNKNFKVTYEGKKYVLRVPGNGAEGMVERKNEQINSMKACDIGITPPIRYFNPENGVKLTDYIENAETLTASSIQTQSNLQKIAKIYQRLHNSGLKLNNEFNVFHEIKKYDKLIDKADAVMYDGWENVQPRIMALESHLRSLGTTLTACHNDGLYENFIKSEEGTVFLIDWEYSGMNDPMADFAALFLEAGFEKENENYILNIYFDGNIPPNTKEKILCYQILWDYLWAQWTVIKEAKGDDFGTYGLDRYNRAIENLNKIKSGKDN